MVCQFNANAIYKERDSNGAKVDASEWNQWLTSAIVDYDYFQFGLASIALVVANNRKQNCNIPEVCWKPTFLTKHMMDSSDNITSHKYMPWLKFCKDILLDVLLLQ